jgi:hypothetical protein
MAENTYSSKYNKNNITHTVALSAHVLHNYLRNICNVQDFVMENKVDTSQSPYATIFCRFGGNTNEEATNIRGKYWDSFQNVRSVPWKLEAGKRSKT